MEKDYYKYFKYALNKYSEKTTNQVLDLARILFEMETSLGLLNFGESLDYRIDEIVKRLKDMTGNSTASTCHFMQNSILHLIDMKIQFYLEYYPSLSKASEEMLTDGLIGEEYWLSSWPHDKILNKKEFFESVNFCKKNWEEEVQVLRNALKALIIQPPYIDLNKYYDVLSL